jgi:hypothetical protein
VLVDKDANVLAANTLATRKLNMAPGQTSGLPCGNVLDCINALLPEGCGKTAACPACMVRSAVTGTWLTGEDITGRPALVTRKNGGAEERSRLLVSTRKDGDVVLLRLEFGGMA